LTRLLSTSSSRDVLHLVARSRLLSLYPRSTPLYSLTRLSALLTLALALFATPSSSLAALPSGTAPVQARAAPWRRWDSLWARVLPRLGEFACRLHEGRVNLEGLGVKREEEGAIGR
jgi:hypothetical protein